MMIRVAVLAAAMLLALAGCGSDGSDDKAEKASEHPTVSAAPPMTLLEACPEIEAALRTMPDFTNKRADYEALIAAIDHVLEKSDTETENAVAPLREAAESYLPDELGTFVDAEERMLEALGFLRTRCEAVGSSALQ